MKENNKSLTIISIDPGTIISGYSVLRYKNNKVYVIEVGELKRNIVVKEYLKENKIEYINYNITIYLAYEFAFKKLFDKYNKLDAVIIEGSFNKRFLLAYLALSTLKMFIAKAVYDSKELDIIELAPRYIKKHITGKGDADKNDMKISLKKYKSLIKKGLKIKELSEHEIDSICIGITYLENIKRNKTT